MVVHDSVQVKELVASGKATIPVLTITQRDSISNPKVGMIIFNTTTGVMNNYNGSSWISVGGTKLYGDNVAVNHLGTTVETDLVSLTIGQNDLGSNSSLLITSGIEIGILNAGSNTGSFNLYVNGSVVKNITLANLPTGEVEVAGTAFAHMFTGLDTTSGNIEVKVTVTNSNITMVSKCHSIAIIGVMN